MYTTATIIITKYRKLYNNEGSPYRGWWTVIILHPKRPNLYYANRELSCAW